MANVYEMLSRKIDNFEPEDGPTALKKTKERSFYSQDKEGRKKYLERLKREKQFLSILKHMVETDSDQVGAESVSVPLMFVAREIPEYRDDDSTEPTLIYDTVYELAKVKDKNDVVVTSLDDLQEEKVHLEVGQKLLILKQLFEALLFNQEHGILHRDIKPENVLLSESNGKIEAKLSDYGIAILDKTGMNEEDRRKYKDLPEHLSVLEESSDGSIVGTLPFIHRLRMRGYRSENSKYDTYSACVSATELLTGKTVEELTHIGSRQQLETKIFTGEFVFRLSRVLEGIMEDISQKSEGLIALESKDYHKYAKHLLSLIALLIDGLSSDLDEIPDLQVFIDTLKKMDLPERLDLKGALKD